MIPPAGRQAPARRRRCPRKYRCGACPLRGRTVRMPELATPTTRVHASFLAAMAEFRVEGRGGTGDDSLTGRTIRAYGGRWQQPAVFSQYVRWLCDQEREDAPRPEGFVPTTTRWWLSGGEYLGRVSIRHWLTAELLEVGGHIGYDVRPS